MLFTCIQPICKHIQEDKEPLRPPKMLCVAGFIFEDLGLVFFIVGRRHARENSSAHVMEVSLDERACLSAPESSHPTAQSCC